jgi:hypothetical protein
VLSKQVIMKCGSKEAEFEHFIELCAKEEGLRKRYDAWAILGDTISDWTFAPPLVPFYGILS